MPAWQSNVSLSVTPAAPPDRIAVNRETDTVFVADENWRAACGRRSVPMPVAVGKSPVRAVPRCRMGGDAKAATGFPAGRLVDSFLTQHEIPRDPHFRGLVR